MDPITGVIVGAALAGATYAAYPSEPPVERDEWRESQERRRWLKRAADNMPDLLAEQPEDDAPESDARGRAKPPSLKTVVVDDVRQARDTWDDESSDSDQHQQSDGMYDDLERQRRARIQMGGPPGAVESYEEADYAEDVTQGGVDPDDMPESHAELPGPPSMEDWERLWGEFGAAGLGDDDPDRPRLESQKIAESDTSGGDVSADRNVKPSDMKADQHEHYADKVNEMVRNGVGPLGSDDDG